MERIIGLDIGSKTIGIAVSDLLKITAQGKENFRYGEWNKEEAVEKIISLTKEYSTKKLVVGEPKHMNGDESDTGRYIKEIMALVSEKIDAEIKWVDERWTSKQAEKSMIKADMSRSKRKQKVDQTAAVIILQAHLDSIL